MQLSIDNFTFDPETDVIGKGGFGEVYKATCPNVVNLPSKVALKKVNRKVPAVKIRQECDLLKQLNHPNIVKCYDYFQDLNGYSYIVMELCEYGDLREYVKKRGRLPQISAAKILKQLVCALMHCHGRKIMHRDLSAGNVLIYRLPDNPSDPNDAPRVKLTDFGLAREIHNKSANTFAGTPGYMPIEMRKGESYSIAADIYSLGSLLFFALTGREPTNNEELNLTTLTEEATELIKCLQAPEVRRIALADIMKSRFMETNGITSTTASVEGRSTGRISSFDARLGSSSLRRRDGSNTSRERVRLRNIQPEHGQLARRQRNEENFRSRPSDYGQGNSRGDSGFRSASVPPDSRETLRQVPPLPSKMHSRPRSVANLFVPAWPLALSHLLPKNVANGVKEMRVDGMRVIVTEARAVIERAGKTGFVATITRITINRNSQRVEFLYPARNDERIPAVDGQPATAIDDRRFRRYDSMESLAANEEDQKQYETDAWVIWQMGHDIDRVTTRHPLFPSSHCRLMENGDVRIVPDKRNPNGQKYFRKKSRTEAVSYKVTPHDGARSKNIEDKQLICNLDFVYRLLIQQEGMALDFGMPFPIAITCPMEEGQSLGSTWSRSSSALSNVARRSTASAPSVLAPERGRPLRPIQLPPKPTDSVGDRYLIKQLAPNDPRYSVYDNHNKGRNLRMSTSDKNQLIYRRNEKAPEQRFDFTKSRNVPPEVDDLLAKLKPYMARSHPP